MRAKEYIEINQKDIRHLDTVKKVIADLYPIRNKDKETELYYTNKLTADWRYDNRHEPNMLNYEMNKKNGAEIEKPAFVYNEGEVNKEIAKEVRNELFKTVENDKSFGYLYYLLASERNRTDILLQNNPVECVPDRQKIERMIKFYRDDYPKNDIDSWVEDKINYDYYLIHKNEYSENDWIVFFNETYSLFDDIRVKAHQPIKTVIHVEKWYDESKSSHKAAILGFIVDLLSGYLLESKSIREIMDPPIITDVQREKLGKAYTGLRLFCNEIVEKGNDINKLVFTLLNLAYENEDWRINAGKLRRSTKAGDNDINKLKILCGKYGVFSSGYGNLAWNDFTLNAYGIKYFENLSNTHVNTATPQPEATGHLEPNANEAGSSQQCNFDMAKVEQIYKFCRDIISTEITQIDFVNAVANADFANIYRNATQNKAKGKCKYIIFILKHTIKEGSADWYLKAAHSIDTEPNKCSGINVPYQWKKQADSLK
jgi:hypothetical protein